MAKQATGGDPMGYRDLVDRAMAELQLKTQAHDASWRLSEADWDVDQDTGTIAFTRPDGVVARAAAQIIGTYNAEDGTWMWGWDHPSVEPALQEHARIVRDYGEKNSIPALITRKQACSEDEAWGFTAVACLLSAAQGAYRGPMGSTYVFMTFGEVTLSQE